MSAFIVGKDHIDALVRAHQTYNRGLMSAELAEVGAMLWAENVKSVQYRYPQDNGDELPGPINCEWASPYTFPNDTPLLAPVGLLKALSCYEYQSCEHPGWATSEAHKWVERTRTHAISHLPGWEEAAWEYERPARAA